MKTTPTSVTINVENYSRTVVQGTVEYVFYINGQEYKELPLDANVRLPDVKAKPYRAMLQTLAETPENFFENNLGITVIAERVEELTKQRFRLEFPSGTGILNGGHTQKAILDSKGNPNISRAIVKVSVREKKYELKRVAEIAAAQNSSSAVKEYSLAEKLGLYVPIKRVMDEDKQKHIIWYEGCEVPESGGIKPDDLIAMINLFHIDLYASAYSKSTAQPTQSASSKSSVFTRWENQADKDEYQKIYPLVNDIIDLSELIKMDVTTKTGLSKLQCIQDHKNDKGKVILPFSGKKPAFDIPQAVFMPMLAAFRANVFYDANQREIGWYMDNAELFGIVKKELCKIFSDFYMKTYNRDLTRALKDPNLWDMMYTKIKPSIDYKRVTRRYGIS